MVLCGWLWPHAQSYHRPVRGLRGPLHRLLERSRRLRPGRPDEPAAVVSVVVPAMVTASMVMMSEWHVSCVVWVEIWNPVEFHEVHMIPPREV